MNGKHASFQGIMSLGSYDPGYGMSGMSHYEKYLTVEDVKRVSGLQDVRQVPFNPEEFLGSDLNFVNGQGDKILCVSFSRASLYDTYRSVVKMNFKARIKGVTEEAFIGPDLAGQDPFILVFRKGDYAVSMTTAAARGTSINMLTVDQLIAIGEIIASRL